MLEGRGRSVSGPSHTPTGDGCPSIHPSLCSVWFCCGLFPAPLHPREAEPCQAAGVRTLWENLTVILQLLKSINPCVN